MAHNVNQLLHDYDQTGAPDVSAADVVQIWAITQADDPGEHLLRAIVAAVKTGYEIRRQQEGGRDDE